MRALGSAACRAMTFVATFVLAPSLPTAKFCQRISMLQGRTSTRRALALCASSKTITPSKAAAPSGVPPDTQSIICCSRVRFLLPACG